MEQESRDETMQKPILYPTLIIGLGGTGTEVVRHVKRRFRNTWEASGADPSQQSGQELPDIIQLLAVDTEPLVNKPGSEFLNHHEFAFLGGFDATRLIQHVDEHSEIASWWTYGKDLPLGYIHSGAKQLRPVGRLAFFRNYVTFTERLGYKAAVVRNLSAREQAQNRGFPVVQDYCLVFIVSSLCGGTGAGMLLDVAHCVKNQFAVSAQVIGILLMPSVFDHTIHSNLQRRRIRANAYATLKEINACQTQSYDFHVRYPSESADIPDTKYRPFDNLFLIERTNKKWKSLKSKSDVEHMVGHMIHLMSSSHMSEKILGLDVNIVHEPPKPQEVTAVESAGVVDRRSRVLGGAALFSSFGVSALTMPREALLRYSRARIAYDVARRLCYGQDMGYGDDSEVAAQVNGHFRLLLQGLRGELRTALKGKQARDIPAEGDRAKARLVKVMEAKIAEEIVSTGLWGAQALTQLCSPENPEGTDWGLVHLRLHDKKQTEIDEDRKAHGHLVGTWYQAVTSNLQSRDRRRASEERAAQLEVEFARTQLADQLAPELEKRAAEIRQQLQAQIDETQQAMEDAQKDGGLACRDLDPHKGSTDDRSLSTLYDLETGAAFEDYPESFWKDKAEPIVAQHNVVEEITKGLASLVGSFGNPSTGPVSAFDLRSEISNWLENNAQINALIGEKIEIRHVISVQLHEAGRREAVSNRLRQAFGRVDPYCPTDFDAHPFNEADLEEVKLVTTPYGKREEDQEFARMMRDFQDFGTVSSGGDSSRMDICWIVHGYPLWSIYKLNELYDNYAGRDFVLRTLHVLPGWDDKKQMPEIYRDGPRDGGTSAEQTDVSTSGLPMTDGSGAPPPRGGPSQQASTSVPPAQGMSTHSGDRPAPETLPFGQ